MSNAALATIAWLAVAAHVAIGIVVLRRPTGLPLSPLVPLLNLTVALCVLAYWAQRWYGYAMRGVTWYATDQLLPLAALVVCVVSGLALAGRTHGTMTHWVVLGIDTLALLAAALFFTLFRMTRLF